MSTSVNSKTSSDTSFRYASSNSNSNPRLSVFSSFTEYACVIFFVSKNFGYKSNKTGFSVGSGTELYDDLRWNTGISSYVEKLYTDYNKMHTRLSK